MLESKNRSTDSRWPFTSAAKIVWLSTGIGMRKMRPKVLHAHSVRWFSCPTREAARKAVHAYRIAFPRIRAILRADGAATGDGGQYRI
jgi:hypothetical protein